MVDVQHGWFVAAVIAFDKAGNMRIIWEGRPGKDSNLGGNDWEEIKQLENEWNIQGGEIQANLNGQDVLIDMKRVFIDAADGTLRRQISLHCARNGWYMVRGDNRKESYNTVRGLSPVSDLRLQNAKQGMPGDAEYACEFKFQVDDLAGHLLSIRDGGGLNGMPELHIPEGVSEEFLREIDGPFFDRIKQKVIQPRGDHAFDVLKMGLVPAYLDGLVEIVEQREVCS